MARPGGAGRGKRLLRLGVRAHLLLLVLAALLPTLSVGAAAAWLALESYRAAAEARLLDTARALALAMDRQIETYLGALASLAAAPAFDSSPPDLAAAERQARAVALNLQTSILLRGPGPDFTQLFNTRLPPGEPPPQNRPPDRPEDPLPRLFSTGMPTIANLLGVSESVRTAGAFVPVLRDGQARFALGANLTPERLSELLAAQELRHEVTATLTDASGVIVARSEAMETLVGQRRPDRAGGIPEVEGLIDGRRITDGAAMRIGFHQLSAAPGWTLWVAQPRHHLASAWQRPAMALGLGALLALSLAGLTALLIARRIDRPLAVLARRAESTAASGGNGPPLATIPETGVRELDRLRLALEAAEMALRRRMAAEQRAADALRDSEARFRAMADNIPQLAWMAHPDGWVFWYNRRWYDYTGTTLEEAQGWGWRGLHDPAHLARAETLFRRRIAAGEPWEDTFPLRGRKGEWRWFLSRALPIRDAAGKVVLWFGTNTDVTAQREADAALAASEERLRLAVDGTGLAMVDIDLDSGEVVGSPNFFTMRGLAAPPDGRTTLAAISALVMPEDLRRVQEEFATARREGRLGYALLRIRRADDGRLRWIESHAVQRREADGRMRLVGVQSDVTARIVAEEQHLLLAREVDHRAKNVLAVVQALLSLTPASGEEARRFAEAVSGRVAAMARAHVLLARARWAGAELRTLLEEELAPFAAGRPEQVALEGPRLLLPADLVQPLALVLHELATNAAKYGALSAVDGRLRVSWRISPEDALTLVWCESDGPPLDGAPARQGFGSRLVRRILHHQLQGRSHHDWRPEGLCCVLTIPLPSASAAPPPALEAEPVTVSGR